MNEDHCLIPEGESCIGVTECPNCPYYSAEAQGKGEA